MDAPQNFFGPSPLGAVTGAAPPTSAAPATPPPSGAGAANLYSRGEDATAGARESAVSQGEEEASPEEQAQFERFVTLGLRYLHGAKTRDQVLKSMQPIGEESAPQALGRVASNTIRMVLGQAEQAGVKPDADVVFNAGMEIVENVVEIGSKAKLVPDTEDTIKDVVMYATQGMQRDQFAKGNPNQKAASDYYAQQVAQEVDRGEAPKGFLTTAFPNMAAPPGGAAPQPPQPMPSAPA